MPEYPPLPLREVAPLPQLGSDKPIPPTGIGSNWTDEDTQRQITYALLHATDWGQSRDIKNHPGLKETNPILGKHPHDDKVDAYFATTGLGHVAAALLLQDPQLRKLFQMGTIGMEGMVTNKNAKIGLGYKF